MGYQKTQNFLLMFKKCSEKVLQKLFAKLQNPKELKILKAFLPVT
jgi:hypothetical protein